MHKVKLFDTVVREYWFEVDDDFDLEAEDAVIALMEKTQGLTPVDESTDGTSIYVDDKEFY